MAPSSQRLAFFGFFGHRRAPLLPTEDQANLAAGSDSLAVQQQAQDSSADAVVAGAAGAAAFLAHSTRAVLRDAARRAGMPVGPSGGLQTVCSCTIIFNTSFAR